MADIERQWLAESFGWGQARTAPDRCTAQSHLLNGLSAFMFIGDTPGRAEKPFHFAFTLSSAPFGESCRSCAFERQFAAWLSIRFSP